MSAFTPLELNWLIWGFGVAVGALVATRVAIVVRAQL